MTNSEFEKMYNRRLEKSKSVLIKKGKEYATNDDRLHNFKEVGKINRIAPAHAGLVLASKHLVNIVDVIEKELPIDVDWIDEKIGDLNNYVFLIEGLLWEKLQLQEVEL